MILIIVMAACSASQEPDDPAVRAAQNLCRDLPGDEQYNCYEGEAVANSNPEICRLVGGWIDDACVQAVYEAAGDPSICDRIYLPGMVPNCQAYYAQRTPGGESQSETPPDPTLTGIQPGLQSTPLPIPESNPSATPTSNPTPTASPTPLFIFDLSGYDPDIFQPVEVSHNPPLIARADETVRLVFDLVNTIYCPEPLRTCRLEPVLYYSYGVSEVFKAAQLNDEIVNEMQSLVARLPATDEHGGSLRYYAEFAVPEAGYTLRYPVAGTIDLFAAPNITPIELPAAKAVAPGETVYNLFWGYGPDEVRQAIYEEYPQRVGPPALAVADDGRIALLDPVNERVLVFNPVEDSYVSYPLPFRYKFHANLAFDADGQLVIYDLLGEESGGTTVPVPYCYRLLPDGKLDSSTAVYVKSPAKITAELAVLDYFDYRLVAPFNSQGELNAREAQRQKLGWMFPYRLAEGAQGLDPYVARFGDVRAGVAYEVRSESPLGVILGFEKTPQGYLMIFSSEFEQIRGVWIDPAGAILKDVTLPNGQYSELSLDGQVAVAQDGSLYVLSSTRRGIEIHQAGSP